MNKRNLALLISKHPLLRKLTEDKTIPNSVVARLIVEELNEQQIDPKETDNIEKLKVEWSNKKAPNMQTKVRRRADGRFQVKYRKEPVLNEKETKDGNRNRKNKRTTSSPKFNADAGI